MSDQNKSKAELLTELAELRQEVARLQALQAECVELKQRQAGLGLVGIAGDVAALKQAEEALRADEDRYKALLNAIPDLMLRVHRDGTYLDVKQPREFPALVSADDIGKNMFEILPPETARQRRYYIEQALQTGDTQIYEHELMRAGEKFAYEVRIVASGQDEVIIMIRDVTERKQALTGLSESEERYRRLFEDSPISLWEEDLSVVKAYIDQLRQEGITDFRTYFDQHPEVVLHYANLAQIIDVNPTTLKLYQAASKEEFFRGLGSIFREESLATFKEEMIAIAAGQSRFEGESVHYTLTGSKIYVTLNWSVAPGYEQTYGKVAVSLIDITAYKETQANLVRQAANLETVAQVSTAVATILETDKLLQEVVDLTKERFGLYHAHLYLLNELGDELMLAAGAGEVGRQMAAEGWSIPIDREQSLVARAARTGQGVIVNDVRAAPDFLRNPLLPETRSELAVPLIVGDQVLGVLDVQADVVDRFTEEDVRIQTTLAAQIGVALRNARSYQQARQAGLQLQERVRELDCLNEVGREIEENPALPELLQWVTERIPAAMRYPDLCRVAIEFAGQIYGAAEAIDLPSQMAHGLYVGGELLGRIHIAYTEKRDFLDEESALLGGIATRVSSYIENQRLIAQLEQRAAELQETTNFMDSIIENLPTMLFVKDAEDLRFVRWNKAGEELLGYSREDLMGKNDYDFFPQEEADFFTSKDREVLAGGKLVDIPEEPIATLHQGTRILHTRKIPIYGPDGKPKYLLGISVDITEQKQNEEALRISEQRFALALQGSNDGIWDWDIANGTLYWSPRLKELLGYTDDELQIDFEIFASLLHPDDTNTGAALEAHLKDRVPYDIEQRLRHKSGDYRWVRVRGQALWDENGQPIRMVGSTSDITEQKQAEEAIRQSEARFRDVVLSTADWVWEVDVQGRYIYCSERVVNVLGYPVEEVLGRTPFDFMAPGEVERIGPVFRELIANQQPIVNLENRNLTKDGHEVVLLTNGVPVLDKAGNLVSYRGIDQDITERKRADQERERLLAELEETTSFLDSIIENLPVMIFVKEAKELRHVRWNKTGLELIGRRAEEMIGKNDHDFFPKEEAEFFEAKDRETLEKRELVEIPEEPVQTADGDIRWLYTRKMPVYGVDGQPRYLLGISVDITERKQADQERERLLIELREALGIADRFRQFVETSTQGIGWANLDGDVIYVNPTLCRLFGEDQPEDIYGKSVAIYYPEETQRRLQEEIFPAVVKEGRWVGELPIASKAGRTIPTFNNLFLVRDDQGQPLYLGNLVTDITERKQAELERERLLAEVEAAYRQYVQQEWSQFLAEQPGGHWRIELAQPGLVAEAGDNGHSKAAVEVPIALRGQPLGSLRLEDLNPGRKWTAEEKALVQAVSEQLAQTVENLRLFENTRQRATREQLTRQITDKMRAAPDVDTIIETGLTELARALGVARTYVKLTSRLESAVAAADAAKVEAIRVQLKQNGHPELPAAAASLPKSESGQVEPNEEKE